MCVDNRPVYFSYDMTQVVAKFPSFTLLGVSLVYYIPLPPLAAHHPQEHLHTDGRDNIKLDLVLLGFFSMFIFCLSSHCIIYRIQPAEVGVAKVDLLLQQAGYIGLPRRANSVISKGKQD